MTKPDGPRPMTATEIKRRADERIADYVAMDRVFGAEFERAVAPIVARLRERLGLK